tara:strand:+ start:398 stop:619 length:222 start_codon:yes stop_codon:yes gene_type:complete
MYKHILRVKNILLIYIKIIKNILSNYINDDKLQDLTQKINLKDNEIILLKKKLSENDNNEFYNRFKIDSFGLG